MNMWWQNNKGDRLHNKGCYHKGQYNVTFFCIKRLSVQPKSSLQPLLPSTKGLSIYFYVILLLLSHHLLNKAPVGEHYCHYYALGIVNVVCIMTGSLLPWITMFSHCLNFRCALHLCFAVSETASEIPLLSYYIMVALTKCSHLRYFIIAR